MIFKRNKSINGGCFASKRITIDKTKIGYMCREKPDDNSGFSDSGWRFFAGDESDEYVNNPDNIGIYNISTIVELDPAILPYLTEPYGATLERIEDKFKEA